MKSQVQYREQDELSLKDLLLFTRRKYALFFSRWRLLLLCGIVGGLLGLTYSLVKKLTYTAQLSFILEGGSQSGIEGYSNIAAQFGLSIGGGGSVFRETDNIIAFIKSRNMIVQTLLTEGEFKGKKQLLVERYVSENKFRDKWKKDARLRDFKFSASQSSYLQDSLLNKFHEQIVEKNLNVQKPDKKLSIVIMRMASKDELFAKEFTEKLLENVIEFYTKVQTKKESENVRVLQHHTDSVRNLLNEALYGVAYSAEANPNPNPALRRLNLPSQKKMVDVEMSKAILVELVKNLELAEISLRKVTPLVQVIDQPVLPLENNKTRKLTATVVGGFVGVVLCLLFIIIRRYLSSVFRDPVEIK